MCCSNTIYIESFSPYSDFRTGLAADERGPHLVYFLCEGTLSDLAGNDMPRKDLSFFFRK